MKSHSTAGREPANAINFHRNVLATSEDGKREVLGPLTNPARLVRPKGMSGRQWTKHRKALRYNAKLESAA